jgi:hypothetical protein
MRNISRFAQLLIKSVDLSGSRCVPLTLGHLEQLMQPPADVVEEVVDLGLFLRLSPLLALPQCSISDHPSVLTRQ